jgi:hypothetical protein
LDKKSGLAGREGRGNFDQRIQLVLLQAVKADAAFRNVFTLDDFVRVRRVANAGGETHADSNVAALVNGPSICIKLSLEDVLGLAGGTHNMCGRPGSPRLGRVKHGRGTCDRGRSWDIGQLHIGEGRKFRNG